MSDEQKKGKEKQRKGDSTKTEKVVKKKEEQQVRKSSRIRVIQKKEPLKVINEFLFKQSPTYVTLHEKKGLIKQQCMHKEGKWEAKINMTAM